MPCPDHQGNPVKHFAVSCNLDRQPISVSLSLLISKPWKSTIYDSDMHACLTQGNPEFLDYESDVISEMVVKDLSLNRQSNVDVSHRKLAYRSGLHFAMPL